VPNDVGAIVRCCLESLALKSRWVIESLQSLTGQAITTIRIVGGGCRNRSLCQMTADTCGIVVVAGPAEATALGNLMVQTVAAGLIPDIAAGRRALADSVELVYYEPRSRADWDAAFRRFEALLAMV
jgi:sugar (pentulose or hexulose) kinase